MVGFFVPEVDSGADIDSGFEVGDDNDPAGDAVGSAGAVLGVVD
jgi:hypothetical protein